MKKACSMKRVAAGALALVLAATTAVGSVQLQTYASSSSDQGNGTFKNPVIYSDVPDEDVIRVGDTYYMVSTTMHLSPGAPIMKSKDLVNWEIVNYVYDILDNSDAASLRNDQNMYGKGSWAASLRYNQANQQYYVVFSSYTTGKTYFYTTKDIENGTWTHTEVDTVYHDMSLLFDDDGKVYLAHGGGNIKIVELQIVENGLAVKEDTQRDLIDDVWKGTDLAGRDDFLRGEGTHLQKINGKYYAFVIAWPPADESAGTEAMRTEVCFRADSLDDFAAGNWERKIILSDKGAAQGGIFDTEDGNWYGMVFRDMGPVGRCPVLVPVTWTDGWPMMGNEKGEVDDEMAIPLTGDGEKSIVISDEFDNQVAADENETETISNGADNDVPAEDLTPTATPTPTPTQAPSREPLIPNGDFESGKADGWLDWFGPTVAITTEEAASGSYSLKVSNRENSTEHGAAYKIGDILEAGKTYEISMKIKYTGEKTPDTRGFKMTFHDQNWDKVYSVDMCQGIVNKNEWTEITGAVTLGSFNVEDPRIFLSTTWSAPVDPDKDLMDFYIDDVVITEREVTLPEEGENDPNGSNLNLEWQWNHNPNNNYWSLTEREGYLRLTTGSLATSLTNARNTLTQRTYGPTSAGEIALEVGNMKDGDVAGLAAFAAKYAYIGVKMEAGKKYLVMVGTNDKGNDVFEPYEAARVELTKDRVYLKAEFNYTTNKANFYYSLDNATWKKLGDELSMVYSLAHFMGYRFGLFNYATEETGGYVDFDYFHVSDELTGEVYPEVNLEAITKQLGNSNPLVDYKYGADPYVMEYDGRVYVYMSSDSYIYNADGTIAENNYSNINTISVISSADLVNWTDHGKIKVAGETGAASWAGVSWAPTATHKTINGKEKFFLYFANSGGGIGVLEADSPIGPFTDPLGEALVKPNSAQSQGVWWLFDPAVFVDDDGSAYLYYGGGIPNDSDGADENTNPKTARVVKLGADMISLDGDPVEIDAPCLLEDSDMFRYKDKYYYSYCTNYSQNHKTIEGVDEQPGLGNICYMVSDSPMGPFTYAGRVLDNPIGWAGGFSNNHHSIFTFQDKAYIAYHTVSVGAANNQANGYRSTFINEISFKEDGTIEKVTGNYEGVTQVKDFSPYQVTEAETIAWRSGLNVGACDQASATGLTVNRALTGICAGDWTSISRVAFGDTGATTFKVKAAPEKGGTIEIRLDQPDGKKVGTVQVSGTANVYKEYSCTLTETVTGTHHVFFVFNSDEDTDQTLMNVDNWVFTSEKTEEPKKDVTDIFRDVNEGDWYTDYVQYVYDQGIMSGMNATTFGPAEPLSRAQFAVILYRMEGCPDITYEAKFPDVPEGQFYTEAVMWACKNNIITGYLDVGLFKPAKNITREEFALMLYRYAAYSGKDVSVSGNLSAYPDAGKVSFYAKEAITWAVANRIITGDQGKLNPQGEASRAACAAMIQRYNKNI